jgi:hypothetical protein
MYRKQKTLYYLFSKDRGKQQAWWNIPAIGGILVLWVPQRMQMMRMEELE